MCVEGKEVERQGLEQAANDCKVVLRMLAPTLTVQSTFPPKILTFLTHEVLMTHLSSQFPSLNHPFLPED